MPKISFEEEADPTKAYADQCWRENPRITPDAWRLSHGWTVGRAWQDGRDNGPPPGMVDRHRAGVNGVLVRAATWTAWRGVVEQDRPSWVIGAVMDEVAEAEDALSGVDFCLWTGASGQDGEGFLADWQAGFERLEKLVQQGQLAGYGVWMRWPAEKDMTVLWPLAQAAAAVVWGRRKRPAWRMLLLPFGPGQPAALMPAGEGEVSRLEWAARHDLLVLAEDSGTVALPGGGVAQGEEEAGQAAEIMRLVNGAAMAEVALLEALGGWPMRDGEPLFSVLLHLREQIPLWPGERVWRGWRTHLWPELMSVWQQLARQQPVAATQIAAYLEAIAVLDAAGPRVAVWGAARWRERVFNRLRQQAPAPGQDMNNPALAALIAASVPGVTGVVDAWEADTVTALMTRPGLADAGSFFV